MYDFRAAGVEPGQPSGNGSFPDATVKGSALVVAFSFPPRSVLFWYTTRSGHKWYFSFSKIRSAMYQLSRAGFSLKKWIAMTEILSSENAEGIFNGYGMTFILCG